MSMPYLRSLQWPVLRYVQKSAPMERDQLIAWVAAGLRKEGKTKGGLAKALAVHQSQITRLLKGDRQLGAEEIPLVSKYIDEPPPLLGDVEMMPPLDAEWPRVVPVVGYVGAGEEAHFYAVAQGDLDEVPAPTNATKKTVAVEVRGESMGRIFDGWLVFYDRDDVRRPVTSDLVGRVCVVGLANEKVLIKKLRNGKNGRYTLVSLIGDPIENAEVEWAAKVKHMEPR